MNGTKPLSCSSNPTAEKIGITFAYCLIFLVLLPGNTVIGVIVYKTKTMRKPINFFLVNVAMSDLLFTLFFIPREIQLFYINSWLISGPLGQALCKLVILLSDVSFAVSIQSLVLIAVDRFGAMVYPRLRSPLISSKLCPIFILATWIVAMAFFSPYLFAVKLVEYPGGLACGLHWNEAFGGSSSISYFIVAYMLVCNFIPLVLIARREFGQRWTATPAKGTKCAKDGNCYSVRVCSLLNAQRYVSVNPLLWIGYHDKVLWLPLLLLCCPFYASGKLCHKSLYLIPVSVLTSAAIIVRNLKLSLNVNEFSTARAVRACQDTLYS